MISGKGRAGVGVEVAGAAQFTLGWAFRVTGGWFASIPSARAAGKVVGASVANPSQLWR